LKIEGSGGILPPKEAGKDACTTFSSNGGRASSPSLP